MLYPIANKYRKVLDLSGLWDFRLDPGDVGERDQWFRGLTTHVDIAVPASWNDQFQSEEFADVEIKNYLGTVWYQKKFFVPSEWGSGRVWLRVGAANYHAKAWVNGSLLGEHEGGFLPFQFEVTEKIRTDRENLVVIKVNNQLSADTIPQGLPEKVKNYPPTTFDYFPYGGIHRPVKLYSTPKNYIHDITITTGFQQRQGVVSYSIDIQGNGVDNIRVSIRDKEQQFYEKKEIHKGQVKGKIIIDNVRLWSPADPVLYDFVVELIAKGKIVDQYSLPIGVRTVKIEGDQLLLNGQPIFLRGICKHEDFPIIGKGMNLPVIIKDFSLLKWINANAFRTIHYPYAEELIYLADKKGFLVMTEVPAVSLSYVDITSRTKKVHKNMLKEMVERDKNHPSIILWGVANEPVVLNDPVVRQEKVISGKVASIAKEYFKEICNYMRDLDNTRPITIATCLDSDEMILKYCDVVSLNRYYGWYTLPGQIDLACEKLDRTLEEFHRKLKKPILVTEFGAGAIEGMHSELPELFTEEYQAEFIEKYAKVIESKPYTIGEIILQFADFKTSQHHRRVMGNRKGIFTRIREPKMAARTVKRMWAGRSLDK